MNIALGWQKIEEDVRLVLDNSLEKSHWGANNAPPDFLTVFLGRGKERKREVNGKGGRKGRGRKGKKGSLRGKEGRKGKRDEGKAGRRKGKRKREGKWRA